MPHQPHPEPHHVGDRVPEEGRYVCVPCGFKKAFKAGDVFPECISCMKDEGWHPAGMPQDKEDALFDELGVEPPEHHYHDDEDQEVAEGLELWEKKQPPDNTAS